MSGAPICGCRDCYYRAMVPVGTSTTFYTCASGNVPVFIGKPPTAKPALHPQEKRD